MRGMKIYLVLITQLEAEFLRKRGFGHDVHSSHSRHKKYYATENKITLNEIEKYRRTLLR